MLSQSITEILESMKNSCQSEALAMRECILDALNGIPEDERTDAYVQVMASEFRLWANTLIRR